MTCANRLRRSTSKELRQRHIDLSAVTFFCSHGLSNLVRCQMEGATKGIAVTVSSDSAMVNRVIRATALDEILPVFPSVEDALR